MKPIEAFIKDQSVDGYMQQPFKISEELERRGADVNKLNQLTQILTTLDPQKIKAEGQKLERAVANASGFTKAIVEHAQSLHTDYIGTVLNIAANGGISRKAYSNYLVQGWYHTQYTPRFEHMFTEKIAHFFQGNAALSTASGISDKDNKFAKLAQHDIDEEEGHELWALMDIQHMGQRETIDVMNDVYPETKAIVWSQHDRLTRLPFIGFLGYSFYLEYLIATHSLTMCEALCAEFKNERTDHRFIYFHYVVDQGHSVDNLQLFDRLVVSESDLKEVLDNMNLIHAMYKGMTVKALQQ